MPTQPSATGALPAAAPMAERQMLLFAKNYERLINGVLEGASQQIELTRELLRGGLDDFDLLAHAQTPNALVEAELSVFRRRTERMMTVMQKMLDRTSSAASDVLANGVFFEAAKTALPAKAAE